MRGSVARRTNTPWLWHFESPGESQQEGAARLTQCPTKGPQHPSARSRQKAPGSPSLRCHVVESCGFYLPNVLRSTAAHPLIVPGTCRGCACLRALARAAVAARDAYPGRPRGSLQRHLRLLTRPSPQRALPWPSRDDRHLGTPAAWVPLVSFQSFLCFIHRPRTCSVICLFIIFIVCLPQVDVRSVKAAVLIWIPCA